MPEKLCKDVIMELFEINPINLLTIGLTSPFYNECATYHIQTSPSPSSFKEELKMCMDMKNISTGGVMNLIPILCKRRCLVPIQYITTKDAVPDLGDGGDAVGFNTSEIITESVKSGADNIVEWLIDSKILRWSLVKDRYYRLLRNATGTVLRILLERFKENIAVGKPKLNMFNAMIMRLVGREDRIAIQTLKDFGYIDSIIHYAPNENPQFVERAIIESTTVRRGPSYNLCGSSMRLYIHAYKRVSPFNKWFYETIVKTVKNEYGSFIIDVNSTADATEVESVLHPYDSLISPLAHST